MIELQSLVLGSLLLLTSLIPGSSSSDLSDEPATNRTLRGKVKVESPPGGVESVSLGGVGIFCIICAIWTLLCGCCADDEGKKKQSYRGSVVCFIIGVAMIVVTVVVFEEKDFE